MGLEFFSKIPLLFEKIGECQAWGAYDGDDIIFLKKRFGSQRLKSHFSDFSKFLVFFEVFGFCDADDKILSKKAF